MSRKATLKGQRRDVLVPHTVISGHDRESLRRPVTIRNDLSAANDAREIVQSGSRPQASYWRVSINSSALPVYEDLQNLPPGTLAFKHQTSGTPCER